MDKATILIVDDEHAIRQLIKTFLERHHYRVLEADCGQQLFERLKTNKIDLIVLDLMLPDIYGIDACKQIREISKVPIIMLTAVQGETSTVLGFEAGADDYIEKPFSAHILLSRIKAILKRVEAPKESLPQTPATSTQSPSPNYQKAYFQHWVFSPDEPSLKHASGKTLFLTRNETTLLKLFLANPESILTRDRIGQALNLDIFDPESRAIDVQVSRLRTKLRDKAHNNLIRSIRNKGYLLTVPVRFSY